MYRKKAVHTGFSTIHGFRHLLGSWNVSPADKGGLLYTCSPHAFASHCPVFLLVCLQLRETSCWKWKLNTVTTVLLFLGSQLGVTLTPTPRNATVATVCAPVELMSCQQAAKGFCASQTAWDLSAILSFK